MQPAASLPYSNPRKPEKICHGDAESKRKQKEIHILKGGLPRADFNPYFLIFVILRVSVPLWLFVQKPDDGHHTASARALAAVAEQQVSAAGGAKFTGEDIGSPHACFG